jgi:DNA replication ATP-dependent helicase Dna2
MPILGQVKTDQNYQRLREIISASGERSGLILLVRQLLEAIYKQLSADSRTSFNGLFARMQYVHTRLDPPPHLVSQVNKLRILCNKVAHEQGFELDNSSWFSSIHTIRSLLNWLNPGCCDPLVEKYLSENKAQPFPAFKQVKKESFQCVVSNWKLMHGDDKKTCIEINATLEDGTDCKLYLNDMEDEGRRWSNLAKVLWQFCTLNCKNLTPVKGRDNCYQSNPSSLIVVEQDFLIDASSLAECFTNRGSRPQYYIINRIVKEASSEKPVQGTLVNNILDELVSSPDGDYREIFRRGMARQPISIVALGKGTALNIYDTIKRSHLPRVREFAQLHKDDSIQLEPSFINPEYGLQGRLDVLYKDHGKMHIVELKSGFPPNYDVWPAHQMQVVAYNMIIRDCFSRSSLGNSSILYSAAEENSLRHVVNTNQLEQKLIMCRNRVVGIMHGLALEPSGFFDWLLNCDLSRDSGFMQSKLENIVSTLRSLEDHEYEWFLEQIRLAVREIWFEKTGGLRLNSIYGHNSLWQESSVAKRKRYRILDELKFDSFSFNLIRLSFPGKSSITDFRVNDIVVLYRQKVPVSNQEILRGRIVKIDEKGVEVMIRGGLRHIPDSFKSDLWALEHDILESSLYNPISSIFGFLTSPSGKRRLFLGIKKPATDKYESKAQTKMERVIERMLASREYHIVQGPPGTGKTSGLLTRYIKKLYLESAKKVLILSFTNRAVDEICLNLKRHDIPFIRTGNSDEIKDELIEELIRDKRFDEIAGVLGACRIWVATVQSCNAWLSDLLKIINIDEIVIDEASQIIENSILGIISKIKKCILIGDHNQLPPITRQEDQSFGFKSKELAGLFYDTYSQSLMERLTRVCKSKNWNDSQTMLNEHYRMHDEIANLIQAYYEDSLVSINPRQKEFLLPNGEALLDSRLVWIDCPPSRHAYYDPVQVQCILRILEILTSKGIIRDLEKDIGIVAPFRAMIHALHRELKPEQKVITIDTVERFQGSERLSIIITLPLHAGSALRNIEAISGDGKVDRKLNVAVSRAQERLIVLGNVELCRQSGHYNLLMDKIRHSGKMLFYTDIIKET